MPVTSPALDDPRLFERRPGVPILDVHTRHGRDVDEARLRLVAANSNKRAAAGDPGLLLIGHTTDDGPETAQPPLVGYVRNYAVGQWDGRPCILADLFYAREKADQAMEYPRRSVEVYYSDSDPAMNYIDAVSLLRRSSERPLGLITYGRRGQKERYAMGDMDSMPEMNSMADTTGSSAVGLMEEDIPRFTAFMQQNRLTDVATALKAFLQAKAAGTDKPDDDEITQADIPAIEKYCRRNKVDTQVPGAYQAALVRYKAERKAGTLHRT